MIPGSLQQEVLQSIHEGHQGITKTRERARARVEPPSSNHSPMCCKERYQGPQFPELSWQMVATDLFILKNNTYLLIVDYFSRYIETVKLSRTTSEEVIIQLKSIFARHGIPQTLRSDNGLISCV